jgi:predicted TPR repeat methyltransferase
VGVDLSSNMLELARKRNLYSRLLCVDLVAALRAETSASYDIVTAADVFIYVGNLDPVIPAVRRALRPGGLFGFSVEALQGATVKAGALTMDGYHRGGTGRYAHAAAYLESLAQRNDFKVELVRESHLRLERNVPVKGWIVVWSASSPSPLATSALA